MRKLLIIVLVALGVVQVSAQPFPLDYSYVGYRQCEQAIPNAPVKVYVSCETGDQSARIQKALDYVARQKMDKKTGLRGAVLLAPGTYHLSKALRISASGVVLRGSDRQKTVLLKEGVDRGAVVYVEGQDNRQITDTLAITGSVALGNKQLSLSGKALSQIKAGTEVVVYRPSTQSWINKLQCASFGGGKDMGYWGWHPGEADVEWSRTVTHVQGNQVTLDAPLSMELQASDADSKVLLYRWSGRIVNAGVENLTIQSAYHTKYAMDEDHAWNGVYIAHAKDCWVRLVDFRNLSGSAVVVQRSGSQITVEDCTSKHPVSELGGYRRRTFLTFGEKCLFQRLYSEEGINDFAAGIVAAGPNAFVQCESRNSHGFSGSIGSWATGLLFDIVDIDGDDIRMGNLRLEKYGTGWNTANSTAYQCSAAAIQADSLPDGSANYVYGSWAQFSGTGYYDELNNHVKPWSLFAQQLGKRLGHDVSSITRTYVRNTGASSNPPIEVAQQMAREAHQPRMTMDMWIDSAQFTASVSAKGALAVDRIKDEQPINQVNHTFAIENGKLVMDHALVVGNRHNSPWWNGRVKYSAFPKLPYGLTRFVPGMEGDGRTDRVDSVIQKMVNSHTVLYAQNYGLWYDRRRDDHERVRRRDGDVWGPFYEQPLARSGEGKAWDGLSKYDMERLNPWYYARLNEFAQKGASQGLLLLNQHYFQHNILEAGAHWVDCPWRTANNINHTGFPEPVPFTGDKRIFMADYFYDLTDPVRKHLHQKYIMDVLDAFADQPNVIHSIGEEFTGPLAFVQFWLDTVKEWEAKRGKKAMVALAVNKDVQDAILQDKARSEVVDIINIEQWYYHAKGLYEPGGGLNLAPRQFQRQIRTGKITFDHVYRGVSEYRKAYPNKAVVYYASGYPQMAWAVLMAGGSCPNLPVTDTAFLKSVASMQPTYHEEGNSMMANRQGDAVFYLEKGNADLINRLSSASGSLYQIDEKTGDMTLLLKNSIRSNMKKYLDKKGVYWWKAKN